MIINERTIKSWSIIGPRATFGLAALELVKEHQNMMILTCDVSTSAGLDRFRKTYASNYLDLGIAEQNMIGVAAGLASENYNVVTTTFAPFQTIRCCEQIKVNFGYMKNKVCMVGLASGLILGNLGFTHCCIEDVGILRTIPNITIISPADSFETVKAFQAALKYNGSVYIRLTGGSNNPIVYDKDYNFEIGKSNILKDGSDVSIFSSGSVTSECLNAAKILDESNISCAVINMHTIKPFDKKTLEKYLNVKLIVSVEEHNVIGGLGSAISETLSTFKSSPRQVFLGINDQYTKGGSYKFLKKKNGLDKDNIISTIKNNFNER
jgi:transketolase